MKRYQAICFLGSCFFAEILWDIPMYKTHSGPCAWPSTTTLANSWESWQYKKTRSSKNQNLQSFNIFIQDSRTLIQDCQMKAPRNPAVALAIVLGHLCHRNATAATTSSWCTTCHCTSTSTTNHADHGVRSILANDIWRMDPLRIQRKKKPKESC